MPQKITTQERAIQQYAKEGNEILRRMYLVLMRVQRKVDDSNYKDILAKIEEKV